jgi:hypothetical protein
MIKLSELKFNCLHVSNEDGSVSMIEVDELFEPPYTIDWIGANNQSIYMVTVPIREDVLVELGFKKSDNGWCIETNQGEFIVDDTITNIRQLQNQLAYQKGHTLTYHKKQITSI